MISFSYRGQRFTIRKNAKFIESISVFGSSIYGDNDRLSDIDFLILIDDCSDRQRMNLRTALANELQVPVYWLSVYCKHTFIMGCKRGSYYFWSLKLFHKPLYQRSSFTEHYFHRMPVFTDVAHDVQSDIQQVEDSMDRYLSGTASAEKTLSSIAHRVRSLFLLLCFLDGRVDFGKYSAPEYCYRKPGRRLPFSFEEYHTLYEIRRKYKAELPISLPQSEDSYLSFWYANFKKFAAMVENESGKVDSSDFYNPLARYSRRY